jgi:hypothetical protein
MYNKRFTFLINVSGIIFINNVREKEVFTAKNR